MPYEVVAEKLKVLPEQELYEVSSFIDFIHFHRNQKTAVPRKKRFFGMAKGLLSYPDDIDEDNETIAKMFGVS